MDSVERIEKYLKIEMLRRETLIAKKTVCASPPNQIYVEPTNCCNLNCIMCTSKAVRGKPGILKFDDWKKIINQLYKYKLEFPITMIGRGEPLINKEMVNFVDYASKHNVPCYLITNGTLLTPDLSRALLKSGIKKVQFSLHAHSSSTYEKITRKDKYDAVKSNILSFLEINKSHDSTCFTSIMAVKSSINKDEIDMFKEFWKDKVDRCFITDVYSVQGDGGMAVEASKRTNVLKKHPGCVIPWYLLGFRYNGNMTICPFDFKEDFVVGKLSDKNFDILKIWNSSKAKRFRACHIKRDFTYTDSINYPCKSCEVPRTVGNCKGIAEWISEFPTAFARQFAPLINK